LETIDMSENDLEEDGKGLYDIGKPETNGYGTFN
jgi:hypothetical protein